MFEATPLPLRERNQWVNFAITIDGQKLPINSRTGKFAKSNDSETWSTFEEAVAKVEDGTYPYIGYSFSPDDPFFFVDLDEEHPEIFAALDTYSQKSVSGKGIHIIGIGAFVGTGTHPRAPAVGIFQENRFCLFTANVIENRTEIKEVNNDALQSIFNWVSGGKTQSTADLVELPPTLEDSLVFERCKKRFDTFESLYAGTSGPDHSESDHALISMLCDESESNEQVRRMFCNSDLCRPHRADKNYIDRSITKTRASQQRLKEIFSSVILELDEPEIEEVRGTGDRSLIDSLPEGLVKDIANYSFDSAHYPLQEASVVVALVFCSALFGRAFLTPTNAGLNLWMILVGDTASGKSEIPAGIGRLIKAVSEMVPDIIKLFGGELMSGPAIEKTFQNNFRTISYFKEFGKTYKKLADPNAQEYVKTLVGGLLDVYNAADAGRGIYGRKKAQDDGEKHFIERPCLCIIGEATPGEFYESMTTRELGTGFLQRFMVVNAQEKSLSWDENEDSGSPPPQWLIDKIVESAQYSMKFDLHIDQEPVKVGGDDTALKLYRYNKRRITFQSTSAVEKEAINRAGLKATRIASILAVASKLYNPEITAEHSNWAMTYTDSLDGQMLDKFKSGNVGTGQVKQEAEIIKTIQETLLMSVKKRKEMGIHDSVAKSRILIPQNWLKHKLVGLPSFASDRNGAVTAFERAVFGLIKNGTLDKTDMAEAEKEFGRGCGVMLMMNKDE